MKFTTILLLSSFFSAPFLPLYEADPYPLSSTTDKNAYAPSAKELLDEVSKKAKGIKTISYESTYRGYNSGRKDSVSRINALCWVEVVAADSIWGSKLHIKGEDHQKRKFDYYYDGLLAYEVDHKHKTVSYFRAHEYGRTDMNNPAKAREAVLPLFTLQLDTALAKNLLGNNTSSTVTENAKEWIVSIKKENKIAQSTQTLWIDKKTFFIQRNTREILFNGTKMVYEHLIKNIQVNAPAIKQQVALSETFSNYEVINDNSGLDRNENLPSLVGNKAAAFSYPSYKNGVISLSSLKGKIVLLDFWESWCGYCILSLPKLNELYKTYRGNRFELLSISTENQKPIEKLLEKNKVAYPNLFAGKQILADYQILPRPTYVLIDENGTIVAYSRGDLGPIQEKLGEMLSAMK